MIINNASNQKYIKMTSSTKGDFRNRIGGFHSSHGERTITKVLHISGEKSESRKFMKTVFNSDSRQLIIEALHANHPMTLSDLSKALKLNKKCIYQNIIILKRIGIVNITRMGRNAGYILNYKKLETIERYNSNLLIGQNLS